MHVAEYFHVDFFTFSFNLLWRKIYAFSERKFYAFHCMHTPYPILLTERIVKIFFQLILKTEICTIFLKIIHF